MEVKKTLIYIAVGLIMGIGLYFIGIGLYPILF